MKPATFEKDGYDSKTFTPFALQNCLDTEWKDVRLSFSDWDWLRGKWGSDSIEDYYLNGYGVEGLVKAVLFSNGIDPYGNGIDYNSEGDTCYVHFTSLETALLAAEWAAAMINDKEKILAAIHTAREQGYED